MKKMLMLVVALMAVGSVEAEAQSIAERLKSTVLQEFYAGQYEYDIIFDVVTEALTKSSRPVPGGGAVWLYQGSEPVMLVFGYGYDMENCEIIKKAMEDYVASSGFPSQGNYSCVFVR
tara:strand:+ start:2597 stop:2950 length:354 start_codon:yes stop_codon:yes gene_type:complete